MFNDEGDPFDLIERGNAFDSASDHWRSADCYSRASTCLRDRADILSTQIKNGDHDQSVVSEKRKVVSLFRAQSLEYLYKARQCLLKAMQFENEQDHSRMLDVARLGSGSLDPLACMISSQDIEERNLTFRRLFSRCTNMMEVGTQTNADDDVDIDQINISSTTNQIDAHQQLLESRLAKLDSSLLPNIPPPVVFGSHNGTKNRMEEIHRGLGRLGVSLPDSSKRDILPDNTLSTEDQMKLIINQAKDEVRVERGMHLETGYCSNILDASLSSSIDDNVINENDSMFDGFEDEEYDIDTLLSKTENLLAKTEINTNGESEIFHSELVHIRRIQALLLEARLYLEIGRSKSNDTETTHKEEDEDDGGYGQNDDQSNVAMKMKARCLIVGIQDCVKELLNKWT
jgi:hypothetical protein